MRRPAILLAHFEAHPDVQQLLEGLLENLKAVLTGQLVGVYLFGSLTGPDFDRYSDIDVLVVTETQLSREQFAELADMHAGLAASRWWCADQLEISYIHRSAVRRYDPNDSVHPHLDRGQGKQLEMTPHDEDWIIQRYGLRHRGITLEGPDPQTLIEPVSVVELRRTSSSLLKTWMASFLDDAEAVQTAGYQSYLVLTVCRLLYTLVEGDVISKPAAVEWAKETLDENWSSLVEAAWRDRQDPNRPVSPERVRELQAFIRFALEMDY